MSFDHAKQVVETLQHNGYYAYIVGGFVRDYLLQRPLGDIDIATSALPEDVQRIFPKTIPVGIDHGTVIVRLDGLSFEVTTFRKEGEYVDYRRPSEVQFHQSIEADLSRRDFTINALAMDSEGKIIDPFDGQTDLKNELLRAVGDPSERFKEDPLRMIRGIRFVSMLGFKIDIDTYSALIKYAYLIEKISIERVRDEFDKLLAGICCEKALRLLEKSRISEYFPGGPFALSAEKDFYDWESLHTAEERWAAFLIRNQVGDQKRWFVDWKIPNRMKSKVEKLIQLIHLEQDFTSPFTLYEHEIEVLKKAVRLKRFLGMNLDVKFEDLESQYSRLPIKDRSELAIDGNDLQHHFERKAGPWIAEFIERIERNVIEGNIQNTPEGIKEWMSKCGQTPGKD